MVQFLKIFLILLLFSGSANAGFVPSGVSTFTVGGLTQAQSAYPIILNAIVLTTVHFSTFSRGYAAAGYQVTAGKQLNCKAMTTAPYTTTGGSLQLLWGTNDVGTDNVTAPTGITYLGGPAGTYNYATAGTIGASYFIDAVFPASSYPAMKAAGSAGAIMYCYESP